MSNHTYPLAPPPPRPPAKRHYGRWIAAAVAAVVVIAAMQTDDSPAPQVAAVTTSVPGSPSTTDGGTVNEIGEWYLSNGWILDDLTDDMGSIGASASAGDSYGVAEACDQLGDTVDDARALPPIPVDDANVAWQHALDEYADASSACSTGARLGDPDLLTEGVDHLDAGTDYLNETTEAIEGAG